MFYFKLTHFIYILIQIMVCCFLSICVDGISPNKKFANSLKNQIPTFFEYTNFSLSKANTNAQKMRIKFRTESGKIAYRSVFRWDVASNTWLLKKETFSAMFGRSRTSCDCTWQDKDRTEHNIRVVHCWKQRVAQKHFGSDIVVISRLFIWYCAFAEKYRTMERHNAPTAKYG